MPAQRTEPDQRTDAVGTASRIRSGEVSAHEVVADSIARIEATNPTLNAVIGTRFDQALEEAAGELPDGPLRGVPILIKDLHMQVGGLPATDGSRLFADVVAEQDSELVARYRRAGMVVLGTTNTPELGLNSSTEPTLHGATHNPWSTGHSSGGSSGGSAAAVAAGLVPVAHGSDGGGSIRIPSSMCGLFGFKPGRGRVPSAPFPSAFSAPTSFHHALTTTVRDSATLLDIGCGMLPGAAFGAPTPAASFAELAGLPLAPLRIGVTTTAPAGRPTDPACVAAVQRTVETCRALGHTVVEIEMPHDAPGMMAASGVLSAAGLVRAVDVRLRELARGLNEEDLEPFSHQLLEYGRGLSGAQVIEALQTFERTGWQLGGLFTDVDVLLTPTLSQPVPELGLVDTRRPESIHEHATSYAAFTSTFNVTGQPAMSVPAGTDDDGLPIGVQFAADLGHEGRLLQLATQLEQAAPWPRVAPGYANA